MKPPIFAALFLFGISPLAPASGNPAAEQLFVTARNEANIFQKDAGPFQLDLDFVVQLQVPRQGHLTLKWESDDRWWRKIVMGNFEQTDIRNGDKLYTSRNAPFTPLKIKELARLLRLADYSETPKFKSLKQRVEDGLTMRCLQIGGLTRDETHEICVNSVSTEIVSDEWKETPDGRRRKQFSDYIEFRGHHYPRKLELLDDGIKAITAHVENLTTSPLDPSLLVAPKGAVERRQCADMKHAVPVKTPDPAYPKSASQNGFTGDSTVAMTVLTDGSVSEIQLIGSATHSMDDATLETLKGWKFKPAMCGTEPVASDIEVVVSFRLY